MDGVTLANFLTTEPRPRIRTPAEAKKCIGVVERSGRGVDKIYRGMLRFWRPTQAGLLAHRRHQRHPAPGHDGCR